jgi:beta-galactosidase/beta-glucuronidase
MASCGTQQEDFRNVLELEGEWQFALDSNDVGIEKQWYLKNLDDVIQLPGTTDSNKKGILNTDTTLAHLNRVYKYEGAAWYRRKITIPGNFEGKHIKLFLERTKPSQIWIDSTMVGSSNLLQSPQTFDVSQYLSPGEHYINVRVNNDLDLTPYGNVHIYSDDSQTNWNGILGKIHLEASPKTHISNLQVYPDIDNEKINVMLEVENPLKHEQLEITLKVYKNFRGETTELPEKKFSVGYEPKISLDYFFCRTGKLVG